VGPDAAPTVGLPLALSAIRETPDPHTSASGTTHVFSRFFRRAPKQSRSRALVDAMLAALEEQLAKTDDPESWTLEALVERAGVGIGSFYEYFSGRDSVLGALVGSITERNFRQLLQVVDRSRCNSLEETTRPLAFAVARAYFDRPRTTRLVISAIGRLGLFHEIVAARDRFSDELALRALPFFPDAPREALAETMRLINDATIGIVSGELSRNDSPDVAIWGERFCELACTLLRSRHGGDVRPAGYADGAAS